MAGAPASERQQAVKELPGLVTTVLLTAGLLADIIIYLQPGSRPQHSAENMQ